MYPVKKEILLPSPIHHETSLLMRWRSDSRFLQIHEHLERMHANQRFLPRMRYMRTHSIQILPLRYERMSHKCLRAAVLFHSKSFLMPKTPSFLGLVVSSHEALSRRGFMDVPDHKKLNSILIGNTNIEDQYIWTAKSTEFTNCSLPAYERNLDV